MIIWASVKVEHCVISACSRNLPHKSEEAKDVGEGGCPNISA